VQRSDSSVNKPHCDDTLSRFDAIPERYGQTDIKDRNLVSISRVIVALTRNKILQYWLMCFLYCFLFVCLYFLFVRYHIGE